jgi:hypothetical protein
MYHSSISSEPALFHPPPSLLPPKIIVKQIVDIILRTDLRVPVFPP